MNLDNQIRWRDYEFYIADNWKVRRNLTLDLGVRYSILNPPFNPDNKAANFVPSLYNPALGSNGCNGVMVPPGTDYCTQANSVYGTSFVPGIPGPNKYLVDSKYNIFAPRVGVSWDPTGSGNNAIRAGFGMFYQRDRTSAVGYCDDEPSAVRAERKLHPYARRAAAGRSADGRRFANRRCRSCRGCAVLDAVEHGGGAWFCQEHHVGSGVCRQPRCAYTEQLRRELRSAAELAGWLVPGRLSD